MPSEFDPQLEKVLHEELGKLPSWKAPDTLAPRVLAAIRARAARPWWQRSWWDWPPAAQIFLVLVAMTVFGALTGGTWLLDQQVSAYSQETTQRLLPLSATWSTLEPLANAGLLIWAKLVQPFVLYGCVGLALVYLSCMGAGTMVVRLVVNRNQE